MPQTPRLDRSPSWLGRLQHSIGQDSHACPHLRVSEGIPHTRQEVRSSYNRLRPLEKLQVEKCGWTLDVLQVVQSLGKLEFILADVYAHSDFLAKLHPKNAHVRDKIRQQLQVLRDLGLLQFLGGGSYRLS
jgi:type II restriction enzyme